MIRRVAAAPTAPMAETVVRGVVLDTLRAGRGWLLSEDPYGNIIARHGTSTRTSPIVFVAHMDHPGFLIDRVDSARRTAELRLIGGGPVPCCGTLLDAFGGSRSASLKVASASRRTEPLCAAVLRARIVRGEPHPGDFAMYHLPALRARHGMLQMRAADDLACVGAMLVLAQTIRALRTPRPVWLVFTRCEEAGFLGAIGLARSGRIPRAATCLSLEASSERAGAVPGNGVVVRTGDRSTIFAPAATELLESSARDLHAALGDNGFSYQRRLMDGGSCEATALSAYGYRSGGLCLPLRNYHNHGPSGRIACEAVHENDVVGMVRLMTAVVLSRDTPISRAQRVKRFERAHRLSRAALMRRARLDRATSSLSSGP